MKLGVCANPQAAPALADAGFEFIELNVQRHLSMLTDEEFEAVLAEIQAAPLPAPAANSFVPGSLKIVGPEVDAAALETYVRGAIARAERAGVLTIVFGSGGARRIPEGFERERAWAQLVDFGKLVGPIAAEHGVVIVGEPLNLGECNVLNTVGETGRWVTDVGHPAVRLLADAYHMLRDDDSYDDIVRYASLMHHVHIATRDSRVAPGFEPCDFSGFFQALKKAKYDGLVSIEGRWDDLEAQAGEAHAYLKRIVSEAGF